MDTAVELAFGDGTYRFHLLMPQIMAIEAGDRSILKMHEDMGGSLGVVGDGEPIFIGGGSARVKDIVSVIRQGLIGGGEGMVDGERVTVSPIDATRIVETYVHDRPLAETLPVAWAVLNAAIMGVRLKKKAGDAEPLSPSAADK